MALEIACDESGYEGERLVNTTTDVFAHASVRIEVSAAAQCVRELRERIRSPATEYKAAHLLRDKNRSSLLWFLGSDGPLPGRADVYLVDKSYAVVSQLLELLGGPSDAVSFYARCRERLEPETWNAFLASANDLMRSKSAGGDEFFEIAGALARAGGDLGATMGHLAASREPAMELRRRLREDPLAMLPMDPLMPALLRAVDRWSDDGPVAIIHDRQTTLPEHRVAQLLAMSRGRLADLRLVSSLTDPRIQVADFLAGVASRRIAGDVLHERGSDELTELLRPYVNEHSIWGDRRTWARLRPPSAAPDKPRLS